MRNRFSVLRPAHRRAVVAAVVVLHIGMLIHYASALRRYVAPVIEHVPQRASISVQLAPLFDEAPRPIAAKHVASKLREPLTHSSPSQGLLVPAPAAVDSMPGPISAASSEPVQAAAASANTEAITRAVAPSPASSQADTTPDYSHNPPPRYPPASRRSQEQGRVLISVLLTAEGTVAEAFIQTSSGSPRLDQAALDAVRQWTFVPATHAGKKVAMRITVPVKFVLSQ